jgi:hypothetical protein
VLLDFTADNNVSVQIEGTDDFQSLDHVLMDGGVANVIRGYWCHKYEALTLYNTSSTVRSLFSEHADGYSKTAICEFGFPISDKTPAARAQDRLSVLAEKELNEADAEWGVWIFADVIESLKRECYVKKDAKFLKRIEQQGDNNNELKDTDVFNP